MTTAEREKRTDGLVAIMKAAFVPDSTVEAVVDCLYWFGEDLASFKDDMRDAKDGSYDLHSYDIDVHKKRFDECKKLLAGFDPRFIKEFTSIYSSMEDEFNPDELEEIAEINSAISQREYEEELSERWHEFNTSRGC